MEPSKKGSKIASFIPKGGKTSAASVKKESAIPASSGIPKPGLKAPAATAKPAATQPSVPATSVPATSEKTKHSKGSQSIYMQKSLGGLENRKTSMVSSTSTSALSGSATSGLGGGGALGGNGVVQLPQQQQYNHPNTATVAPFMYR